VSHFLNNMLLPVLEFLSSFQDVPYPLVHVLPVVESSFYQTLHTLAHVIDLYLDKPQVDKLGILNDCPECSQLSEYTSDIDSDQERSS